MSYWAWSLLLQHKLLAVGLYKFILSLLMKINCIYRHDYFVRMHTSPQNLARIGSPDITYMYNNNCQNRYTIIGAGPKGNWGKIRMCLYGQQLSIPAADGRFWTPSLVRWHQSKEAASRPEGNFAAEPQVPWAPSCKSPWRGCSGRTGLLGTYLGTIHHLWGSSLPNRPQLRGSVKIRLRPLREGQPHGTLHR